MRRLLSYREQHPLLKGPQNWQKATVYTLNTSQETHIRRNTSQEPEMEKHSQNWAKQEDQDNMAAILPYPYWGL